MAEQAGGVTVAASAGARGLFRHRLQLPISV